MRLPALLTLLLLLLGDAVALARPPRTVPGFLRAVARRMNDDPRGRAAAPLLRKAARAWYKQPERGRNFPRQGSVVVEGKAGRARVSTDAGGGFVVTAVVYDPQGRRQGEVRIDQPNLSAADQDLLRRVVERRRR